MAERPENPDFITNPSLADFYQEPPIAIKQKGWKEREALDVRHFNWILSNHSRWISYLDETKISQAQVGVTKEYVDNQIGIVNGSINSIKSLDTSLDNTTLKSKISGLEASVSTLSTDLSSVAESVRLPKASFDPTATSIPLRDVTLEIGPNLSPRPFKATDTQKYVLVKMPVNGFSPVSPENAQRAFGSIYLRTEATVYALLSSEALRSVRILGLPTGVVVQCSFYFAGVTRVLQGDTPPANIGVQNPPTTITVSGVPVAQANGQSLLTFDLFNFSELYVKNQFVPVREATSMLRVTLSSLHAFGVLE